jgi:hypothetical protein
MRTLNAPTEYEQRLIDRYNERLAVHRANACFLCGRDGYFPLAAVPGPADGTDGTTDPSPVCNRAHALCRPCDRQNIPFGWQRGTCSECGRDGKVTDDRFDGAAEAVLVCGRCLRRRQGRTHNCY